MNTLKKVKELLPDGFTARWAPDDHVIEILHRHDGMYSIGWLAGDAIDASSPSTAGMIVGEFCADLRVCCPKCEDR